jgi:hypothetical protein
MSYDHRGGFNWGIVVRLRNLVGNRLVYFDYNSETQGWVIRDFIVGRKLDHENSSLSIKNIEEDADMDEFPPWLNVHTEAAEWEVYLKNRTIAVLGLHNHPISTDSPNRAADKWLPLKDDRDQTDSDEGGNGKEHLKAWWKPVLRMKFDNPDQGPPYWVGTNNVVLSTPFPGILIKAASLKDRDYIEVFLSATRNENLRPIKHLASRDSQLLLKNLPKGTIINDPDLGWPVAIKSQEHLEDSEKYVWLIKNLNAFVNVLRPHLKKWYDEIRE